LLVESAIGSGVGTYEKLSINNQEAQRKGKKKRKKRAKPNFVERARVRER
jgi:hypothetical protein